MALLEEFGLSWLDELVCFAELPGTGSCAEMMSLRSQAVITVDTAAMPKSEAFLNLFVLFISLSSVMVSLMIKIYIGKKQKDFAV